MNEQARESKYEAVLRQGCMSGTKLGRTAKAANISTEVLKVMDGSNIILLELLNAYIVASSHKPNAIYVLQFL